MTSSEYKEKLLMESCDVVFSCKNKPCGVTPIYDGKSTRYEAWYGEELKVYSSIDDYLNDPIYDGKSITQLLDEKAIEFDFY